MNTISTKILPDNPRYIILIISRFDNKRASTITLEIQFINLKNKLKIKKFKTLHESLGLVEFIKPAYN